ncbi:bifunctional proline dehydrogenase/L-glutamate gamma-semialdehyde dehydrogenase PutA [Limobrevibacterium gyesilva]|uniref:Bifunctional protein PutA n=1 Tax=Limobrevibacterium gyesilva TaxID=2991712 RepID=A0AA42CGR3_9PROT|nr:bifunctional proline dehydrogenase/L-glutamate gamma-semialdehyde dehydrogenase PutA [Limobrevibacterium gyesilva]MCW3474242.1 bifunctional proline dehydrogenase/L-glutamate gamma-semialdehyde dehydrogenase PutA [Limobrevibacterium gyesilva]
MPDISTATDDRPTIRALHRAPEAQCLAPLLHAATLPAPLAGAVDARARALVRAARAAHKPGADVTDFLKQYGLGTKEGIALLCLAEALLRIPDSATADALIEDRIATADWQAHLGQADSMTVNASAWAFMLTGRVLTLEDGESGGIAGVIRRVVQRMGEPVIRTALRQGMRVLARQFVMGRTIAEALARAGSAEGRRWRYSFDMLGEAARTRADADRYMRAYRDAIGAIGRAGGGPVDGPGVSVKLSALHPRYEPLQERRCVPALTAALTELALAARAQDIGLTMDAEEAERLEISLDIFAAVMADPRLAGWDGLGLAIQAYQKRALPVVDWVAELGRRTGHRIPARLVKGAYWDTEIKLAQVQGHDDYPVFTRKLSTDVSWIACARRMLDRRDALRPAFATHNAHSLATILELAGDGDFEMQRLHGMGEALYDGVVGPACPVRVYAPVGSHEDLLAYLVRRLLENGANTSFVHRLVDPAVPEEAIVADPARQLQQAGLGSNPRIPRPAALYPDRKNSAGLDLADRAVAPAVLARVGTTAMPRTLPGSGAAREIRDPADRRRLIGTAPDATPAEIDTALAALSRGWLAWDAAGGAVRAAALDRAADLIEAARDEFLFLLAREAGRTLPDGISEVREAADFCRWYAARAREHFAEPRELAGPTGERNTWALGGRGVFTAISPWNFPLAIFTGQVAAALAAGNAVAAKPAEQTPLIAARAVELLHMAGVPTDALRLLTGDGRVGAALVSDKRIAGVAFTGSTDTAQAIARALAARPGPLVPFIAETGGINAMIVDSSALPEQVVADVLASAFGSAGQRCSALRLLCVQEDVADRVLDMLKGAAETLAIGDPLDPATDIGPVIDADALTGLQAYAAAMGTPLFELALPPGSGHGTFFAPRAYALPSATALDREVFGPVLHVVRYAADRLDVLLDEIDANGYGLTLGVHSRIESTQRRIVARMRVGNAYVNRNQIGAVVGVQPFGGRGLSGTGPKAGGPITLFRFAEERVVSVNTAAAGGNAALLASDDG